MSSSTPPSAAAPTAEELQRHIVLLTAQNVDLNTRGTAVQKALELSTASLAAVRAPRPKIPTPRVFDGKVGAAIDSWIDENEKQFAFFGPYFADDKVKIEYALNFVNHEVGNWYKPAAVTAAANGIDIDTWVKFIDVMRTRYQPIESSFAARTSFDSAVQSNSVQAYSTHVQSLMTYIKDMSAADQVHGYCRGLKPHIRLEVMKSKPKTLTDAIEKAVGIEAYSRGIAQSSSTGNSSSHRPYQPRSSYSSSSSSAPMDVNHVDSRPESEYLDASASRESHLLAVIKQQQENFQQQLNALAKRSQDSRSSSSSQSSGAGNKIPGITREVYRRCRDEDRCLKCKEIGHIASACTKPLRLNW
jgi:hypothetical protein